MMHRKKFSSSDLIVHSLIFDFLVLTVYLTSTLQIQKDEYEEKRSGEIRRVVARVNQVPLQALAAGIEMPNKPTGLTDGKVRTAFVQMAQTITLQA